MRTPPPPPTPVSVFPAELALNSAVISGGYRAVFLAETHRRPGFPWTFSEVSETHFCRWGLGPGFPDTGRFTGNFAKIR